ncbi:MAG: hypothetical protein HQL38_01880, partial [Alphaproteobacteria bacterium]|nr:hypothetical protein [Alphaproteobacteria bacterium]
RSRATLSAAAEAGCVLLGGPALSADQPKPGPRLSLPRDRLLAVPK